VRDGEYNAQPQGVQKTIKGPEEIEASHS
jgi:hypothetical protein